MVSPWLLTNFLLKHNVPQTPSSKTYSSVTPSHVFCPLLFLFFLYLFFVSHHSSGKFSFKCKKISLTWHACKPNFHSWSGMTGIRTKLTAKFTIKNVRQWKLVPITSPKRHCWTYNLLALLWVPKWSPKLTRARCKENQEKDDHGKNRCSVGPTSDSKGTIKETKENSTPLTNREDTDRRIPDLSNGACA